MLWRIWDGCVDGWYRLVDSRIAKVVAVVGVVAGAAAVWMVRTSTSVESEARPFRVFQQDDGNLVVEVLSDRPFPAPVTAPADCDGVEAALAGMLERRDVAEQPLVDLYWEFGDELCSHRRMGALHQNFITPLRDAYQSLSSDTTPPAPTGTDPAPVVGGDSGDATP